MDGSVASYFSDHFTRQLMAGIMAQDYLGLCPKPSHRVEGGGATGGICFQEGWKAVASGYMDVCLAYGFEQMSHVETWKGNEFIALASDVSFDYPVGGFYSGYYAMMVTRRMAEFGTTRTTCPRFGEESHQRLPQPIRPETPTLDDCRRAIVADGGLAADAQRYLRDERWSRRRHLMFGRRPDEAGKGCRPSYSPRESRRHWPGNRCHADGRPSPSMATTISISTTPCRTS